MSEVATVTLAGASYTLTPGGLSLALDISQLATSDQSGDRLRAGAAALAAQCPALAPRLGIGPYRGDAWAYGGQVIDALADPNRRSGKAKGGPAASEPEIYAACVRAIEVAFLAFRGASENEVEAAARPTEPTPSP